MRVWTHPPQGRLVILKHFRFTYEMYELLLKLQQMCPNLLLEIEPEKLNEKQFLPAHQLNLEDFRKVRLLNIAA